MFLNTSHGGHGAKKSFLRTSNFRTQQKTPCDEELYRQPATPFCYMYKYIVIPGFRKNVFGESEGTRKFPSQRVAGARSAGD